MPMRAPPMRADHDCRASGGSLLISSALWRLALAWILVPSSAGRMPTGAQCARRQHGRGQPAGTITWQYRIAGQGERPWRVYAPPHMTADAVQAFAVSILDPLASFERTQPKGAFSFQSEWLAVNSSASNAAKVFSNRSLASGFASNFPQLDAQPLVDHCSFALLPGRFAHGADISLPNRADDPDAPEPGANMCLAPDAVADAIAWQYRIAGQGL